MSLVGVLVSLLRGRQFYYEDGPVPAGLAEQVPARSPAPDQPPNGNSPAHRLAPGDPARAAGAGGMD
jgi:hypothetical protein